MRSVSTVTRQVLRNDRAIVAAGMAAVMVASWLYILTGAGMAPGGMMEAPAAWSPGYALLMVAMWVVMMAAMMLPSTMPMILLFSAANRKAGQGSGSVPTFAFVAGYLAIWGAFSAFAVAAQWLLASARLLSPMMDSASLVFGGMLLVAAGAYQLTPFKDACLRHCRTPMSFVMQHWRPGRLGALRMGMEHGAFCLGCCWVLMGLLFYGGVMNLAWIGGLTAYVLIEKFVPMGDRIAQFAGGLLIVWGAAVLWSAAGL